MNFALCGGRLKKLFEKSFFRIFKNFINLLKDFGKRKKSLKVVF